MRRLLLVVVIAALGLLAGIVVAGRPEEVPSDLQAIDIPPSTATTTSTSTTTLPPTTSTTTTTTSTTTTSSTVAPTTTTLVPEREVTIVVANASDTFGLAGQTAEDIRDFGYVSVVHTDGLRETASTAIYYVAGFEGEAERLAQQLGTPTRRVDELPSGPLIEDDVQFDLLVLLGNDWRESTNLESTYLGFGLPGTPAVR